VKHKVRIAWLALAGAAVLLFLFRASVLGGLGAYLVKAEAPRKSDVIFVLGGDAAGNRILKAGELVREGYAPHAIVSGPGGFYGVHECELAIPFAVKAGYPESYFVHFEHDALSTMEESAVTVAELRRMGAHSVMLVTSDYHTRRAGKIFRASAPDIDWNIVAAPDRYFSAHGWWHNREGRKTFMMEWMKTVAEWLGL
jgi:uncharacterized SAM-binding protein YcdF (DUF218 family)